MPTLVLSQFPQQVDSLQPLSQPISLAALVNKLEKPDRLPVMQGRDFACMSCSIHVGLMQTKMHGTDTQRLDSAISRYPGLTCFETEQHRSTDQGMYLTYPWDTLPLYAPDRYGSGGLKRVLMLCEPSSAIPATKQYIAKKTTTDGIAPSQQEQAEQREEKY